MPDPDDSPPTARSGVDTDYPMNAGFATQSLHRLIREEIGVYGPMALPRYLELALYHPEWGYYARGGDRVGRQGDFFTSVSVGSLFGSLLARRAAREFHSLGCPERWRIAEFGANDGALAADILGAMEKQDPSAFDALEYAICEPLPTMRRAQKTTLEGFGRKARVVAGPNELAADPLPGLVLGNEVLDALPFRWVEWRSGRWRERGIDLADSAVLKPVLMGEPAPETQAWLEQVTHGIALPDGWQCEVRTCWQDFLRTALRCVEKPTMLWIDYGFERSELIQPARKEGTWRAFREHRIEPDPWDQPGVCDLTAHVDFTGVAQAAEALGGRASQPLSQGNWLTRIAAVDLASREGQTDPTWVRQFQTLTHPAHLGARFHVLECTWR